MEKNPSTPEEKLQFLSIFGMIKSAIKIPFTSLSFIAFTFLTSLPLLLMMSVERLLAKRDFIHMSGFLMQHCPQLYNVFNAAKIVLDWGSESLRLGPYEPFNLLIADFLTAVSAVYSASTIYSSASGRSKSKGVRDLLQNFKIKSKWNEAVLTFLFTSFFTYISVDAFQYWADSAPKFLQENSLLATLNAVLYFLVLFKWTEYSCLSETAVVVSILEEKKTFEAFSSTAKLTKGRRIQGLILSVAIVVALAALFSPTVVEGRTFNRGIEYVVHDWCLRCVGKVMRWVVLVVYYHDCKNRQKLKLIVENGGEHAQV